MLWNNRDVDGASKLDPLPWAMAWLRIRNDKFFYKEEKYQINVGSVRVGWLGPCPLPYGNALRIICLYVVNLALKISGIKKAGITPKIMFSSSLKKIHHGIFDPVMVIVICMIF